MDRRTSSIRRRFLFRRGRTGNHWKGMEVTQTFSTTNLPSDPSGWQKWRKIAETSAIKIDGPFTVETSEGPLTCQDGYLAVDARGYPYPIATDEFKLIYEPVGS